MYRRLARPPSGSPRIRISINHSFLYLLLITGRTVACPCRSPHELFYHAFINIKININVSCIIVPFFTVHSVTCQHLRATYTHSSYNLYPVPQLSTCAFIYCISGPFSAYPAPHLDWKKFSKTYPAMQIKCTVFIRTIHSAAFIYCISGYPASAYCISGCFLSFYSYVDLYNSYPAPTTNWTNQSTLYKFALCFLSAFHGYVYLYNLYLATQINWTVFRRIF